MAKVGKSKAVDHLEFLWSVASGFQGLDAAANWPESGEIRGLSVDGSVLVGLTSSAPHQSFRWTTEGGAQQLGTLPGFASCSLASYSQDLSVLFGSCENDTVSGPSFRWTQASGMLPLTQGAGGAACRFYTFAPSRDGATLFGTAACGTATTPSLARWSVDTGVVLLEQPAGTLTLHPSTSSDGNIAFGLLLPSDGHFLDDGSDGTDAFRWQSADGLVALGHLPGHAYSSAYAADAHGDTLVGRSGVQNGASEAVLWDHVGLIRISAYLTSLGADLHGAHLQNADRVVSHDGTTVVQGVTNAQERSGAWIAWLPQRP
jgi:uncharacterized membrane protein